MFTKFNLIIIISVLSFQILVSQEKNNTELVSKDTIFNLQKKSETITNQLNVDSCCTPIDQFTHAGNRRWLIDGTQPYKSTKIKPISAVCFGSALAGIFVVQHIMQQNTIWKQVGPFHFYEDWQFSLGLDKGGHFFGAYASSYLLSEILMAIGFSWDAATITGSGLGLLYTGYVEILDGQSVGFGFSPSDFYADMSGSAFLILQHYVPFFQNFSPKFMYLNPKWIGEARRKEAESFIDDYSSQTFWLSINVHNLLPHNFKDYWPDWLELSLGYGVFSLCTPGPEKDCSPGLPISNAAWGNRSLLIGLDVNLVTLLPDGGSFWNWAKQSLNLFKLVPSPTLQISDRGTKFYLLFPFKINL